MNQTIPLQETINSQREAVREEEKNKGTIQWSENNLKDGINKSLPYQ